EINSLCHIAHPDYGLITNVGKAHLEGFGGIEGVARAKGELIRYLMAHEKTVFLNEGNKWLADQVPAGYPHVIRYNTIGGLVATEVSVDPYLCLTVKNGINAFIKTNLAGGYNAENVLAACAVGLHFGISMEKIKEAISEYEPRNNRSQIIKTTKNTIFMDAYNANPSSMAAAIEEFLKNTNKRKMLILGEMREVGEASDAEHAEIVAMLKRHGISNAFCIGKAFEKSASDAGYKYSPSVEQLSEMLKENPPEGYYIMVKGSRGNRLEKILPYI
ncbi:MAG TPA: UDP-N-acetylmuramoyl-tripeptide--D-alanyl-D-alanine ligase, partial [Bacteroidales bacterium]|nr:UDP-N-acetylmuramoyl-tripeptide--D-alanyl-D-alanine ligase [Bacteroidales bacterium]